MRHALMGCWVLLSGCWLSDAEVLSRYDADTVEPDSGDVDTTDADGETTVVRAVEPNFGTNAGQQLVVIEVDGIGADLAVSFGSASAEIVSTDGNFITVRTPRGDEGAADVTVSSGGASGTLDDGYWFWEDAAGAFGTQGHVTYYDYTGDLERLGYLDTTVVDVAVVEGSFEDFSSQFGDGLDSCQVGIRGFNTPSLDLQAPDIQLQGPQGSSTSFFYDEEAEKYAGEFSADDARPGVVYDMLPFDGSGPFPAFGIEPLADLPGAFSVQQPSFTQERPLSTAIGADVGINSFDVEWTQPDGADYAVLELVRWGPDATNTDWVVYEVVSCLAFDDGQFSVPFQVWTSWNLGAPVDVYVSRVRTTESVLPNNNSVNGVVGRSLVAGTVYQALF